MASLTIYKLGISLFKFNKKWHLKETKFDKNAPLSIAGFFSDANSSTSIFLFFGTILMALFDEVLGGFFASLDLGFEKEKTE